MMKTDRKRFPPALSLVVAGGLMIFAGLSVAGLALSGPSGTSVTLSTETVAALLIAVLLAGSGVETIRRRHYWFALLAPVVLALMSAGYAIVSGQSMVVVTVVWYAVVVALVASNRSAFSARATADV